MNCKGWHAHLLFSDVCLDREDAAAGFLVVVESFSRLLGPAVQVIHLLVPQLQLVLSVRLGAQQVADVIDAVEEEHW